MNPTSGSLPGNTHEDLELQLLHEEAIGHWTTPVVDFQRVKERYVKAIRQREREHHDLWGFKDPRLCFLLPWVLEIIRCEVKIIFLYRARPMSARSLVRANPGMEERDAQRITNAYDEARRNAIIHAAGYYEMYPLFYDDLVNRPRFHVPMLAGFVGVPSTKDAIQFVDPEMRHFK